MTRFVENDEGRLREQVLARLGPVNTWPKWRGGWVGRADLALLDAVYSSRQRYELTVLPNVRKWRDTHPNTESHELLYLCRIEESFIREEFGNNLLPGVRKQANGARRLKSEGVIEVARNFCESEKQLSSAQEICDYVNNFGAEDVLKILRQTKGIGPATSSYFLMLLGIDGVKVDTLLASWVRRNLNQSSMSTETISQLVSSVATEEFKVQARDLDYAIWRHESTERMQRFHRS
jgi:hypothetical protein